MTTALPTIPAGLRQRTERLGDEGRRWLVELPTLVAECADRWSVEPGYGLDVPGNALLVRGRGRSGSPVVVKLCGPGYDIAREAAVLEAARGRGYVLLLDSDADRRALLLEGLGPELDVRAVEARQGTWGITDVLVSTLRQAWSVERTAVGESPDASPAVRLRDEIVAHLPVIDVPDCARAVERALSYADQRFSDRSPERDVVLHGDPTVGRLRNVQAPRPGADSGYVFVDPQGVRGPREFDLAVVIRDANRAVLSADDPVVLVRRWCAVLAEQTEGDAEAIWQWSYIQRVACGLALSRGDEPLAARAYLQTAMALISRWRG